MSFDFQKQFKDYSTTELLKIVKRPGEYQPAAVAVAQQILNEREVTIQDELFVDQYFQDIDNLKMAQKEKVDAIKNKAADFLEPITKPSEKVEVYKWLNILLAAAVLQYAWSLFTTVKRIIRFLQCDHCGFDINFYSGILTLLYIPLIFLLLYKRKRWGWILLFGDNLISLILGVGELYLFFKYQNLYHGNATSSLFFILVKAAIVFFLWRDAVANYFNVSFETKRNTAVVATLGVFLFILCLRLIY